MRAVSIHPRPDQITELTRGLQLPLPEVPTVHLDIIAESLLQAFGDIRAQAPATVASGTESEVTALLEARLNAMIEHEPLWGQLVLCVARGKESLSFDGSHLEKRPDLSIYLSNRNRSFPLITEAKIIDAAASKTEALYCDNGIRRFVEGEYAWGNREAFMIAYVRDGSSIGTKLTPFLSNAVSQSPPGYFVEGLPMATGSGGFDLAHSKHGRSFLYSSHSSERLEPGSISIWHLWLS
ncbi:hypothetical protein [Rhizobium hainanense]|uniref:Uncharacterized protein n=1 Tax=Rhizobium hainanense TaxID=52131 RepID=A0A1C3U5K8_9HYPH|nr:hypothetical protein [Rhizobium hainanense]SCB10645.1 hypothetical protein GA0061100_101727 [Rhizobium hainanense]